MERGRGGREGEEREKQKSGNKYPKTKICAYKEKQLEAQEWDRKLPYLPTGVKPPTVTVVAPGLASITPSVVTRPEDNSLVPPGLPQHDEQPFGRQEVITTQSGMRTLYLHPIRQAVREEPGQPVFFTTTGKCSQACDVTSRSPVTHGNTVLCNSWDRLCELYSRLCGRHLVIRHLSPAISALCVNWLSKLIPH